MPDPVADRVFIDEASYIGLFRARLRVGSHSGSSIERWQGPSGLVATTPEGEDFAFGSLNPHMQVDQAVPLARLLAGAPGDVLVLAARAKEIARIFKLCFRDNGFERVTNETPSVRVERMAHLACEVENVELALKRMNLLT